jgi:hypothetical protein
VALFHICTLVTDTAQYEAMKRSFVAAGFDEERCRYTVLDNRGKNHFEGFGGFNVVQGDTTEPYLIFCHQDLLLESGDGFETLVSVLKDLDQRDPRWAVLGNAGWSDLIHLAMVFTDPVWHGRRLGRLPQRVQSLDENFLVVRTETHLRCSPELSGFHLFATDLCLHASLRGLSCYVIDFHLTHLSQGNRSKDFYAVRQRFVRHWNRAFAFQFIRTPSTILFLSRYRPLQWALDSRPIRYLLSRPAALQLLAPLFSEPR